MLWWHVVCTVRCPSCFSGTLQSKYPNKYPRCGCCIWPTQLDMTPTCLRVAQGPHCLWQSIWVTGWGSEKQPLHISIPSVRFLRLWHFNHHNMKAVAPLPSSHSVLHGSPHWKFRSGLRYWLPLILWTMNDNNVQIMSTHAMEWERKISRCIQFYIVCNHPN